MATLSREEILALTQTDVRTAIPQETLLPLLTTAPFIPTRSLVNIRDVGAVPGSALPSQKIYRCGALSFAAQDPEAIAWLSSNVKKVFDLRKGPERANAPDPEIPGVENFWFDTEGEYPMPDLETFAVGGGAPAWGQQLLNVTDMYKGTIRALLEHVRDHPEEPFVFHCTAGRDRTGVVAGILQTLAGTSPDDIVYDYLLSRIGTEAAREKLVKFAMGSLGIEDIETPGFVNVVDLRPEFWHAFVKALGEKYGGVDGYLTQGLGFSEEGLGIIKKNLRA